MAPIVIQNESLRLHYSNPLPDHKALYNTGKSFALIIEDFTTSVVLVLITIIAISQFPLLF